MNLFHQHTICRLMCPALFLLSACSASEAPGEDSSTFVPVQINSVALPTEVATRATPPLPLTSGSIGVFSLATDHGYSKVYNAEYTYNTPAWSSATPITVAGYPATLCAYHPYGAASFAPGSTTFDLTAQLYAVAQDLSYALASADTKADNNDADVTFAMVKGYARLSLEITCGKSYAGGACKISNVSLKKPSGNLQSVRTLDIRSGVYGDKTEQEMLTFTNLGALQNTGIASEVTDKSLHLLLPPQSVLGGLHLLLTIDGVVRSLAIGSAQLNEWLAGKDYVVKVNVNETGISISSVSTKNWANKPIAVGPTPGTPYDSYVILPSINFRVAKGNLMRDGADGAWYLAPDQGFYTGKVDGGDYFNWGIADPTDYTNYHATNTEALTAGCVAVLGAGWRVPTKDENVALASVADKKWGTYQSQRGTSNGYYFGTGEQPTAVNQDTYVFLPAAGIRSYGSMYSLGDSGDYLSSESNGDGSAWLLHVSNGYIKGDHTMARSVGFSVRCVAPL